MAKLQVLDTIDTSLLIQNESKVSEEIQELANFFSTMTEGKAVVLSPDDGETMRTMKVRVSRAATHANVEVKYGETQTGGLMIWRMREQDKPKKRNGKQ